MKSHKFLSSGGLGDSWINLCQILDHQPESIEWTHFTGHQEHVDPITELMSLLPNITHAKCFKITKDTKTFIEETAMSQGATRLITNANNIKNPILNYFPFRSTHKNNLSSYAIVQPIAGRQDNSLRKFMPYAVNTLIEHFRKLDMRTVLLGMSYDVSVPDGTIDMSGKTTIKQAIELIKYARHVIAYDGFIAYCAMAFGVPTTIIFHDARLPEVYMHKKWREKTNVMIGPQRISHEVHDIIKTMEHNHNG